MPRLQSHQVGYEFIVNIEDIFLVLLAKISSLFDSFDDSYIPLNDGFSFTGRSNYPNNYSTYENEDKDLKKPPGRLRRLLGRLNKLPGRVFNFIIKIAQNPKILVNYIKQNINKDSIRNLSKKRKVALFFIGVFLILLPITYITFLKPRKVVAWWNSAWLYRKEIEISYSGTTTLTNFQVMLEDVDVDGLNGEGKLEDACEDIRFVDVVGQELDYWIGDNSAANDTYNCTFQDRDIWVEVPSIENGTTEIYMYYGNPDASSNNNGDGTFALFDDFTSGTLSPVWDQTEDTVSFSSGNLILKPTNDALPLEGISSAETFGNTNPQDNDNSVLTMYAGQNTWFADGRLGFSNTPQITLSYTSDDSAALFFDNTTSGPYETESSNGGSVEISSFGSEIANFKLFQIIWDGTNSLTFKADSDSGDHTTQIPNSAQYVRLEATDSTYELKVDYIFVRKFASVQPTTPIYSSYGAEEEAPDVPTMYLKFDEGYGDTVQDSTSYNNDAAVSGAEASFPSIEKQINLTNTMLVDGEGDPPISEWLLDESSGDNAPDSVGSNDGTLSSSMTDADWVGGYRDNALDFDGVLDWVDTADSPFDFTSGEFTLVAWVYEAVGAGSSRQIVSKRDVGASGYAMAMGNSNEVYCQTEDAVGIDNSHTTVGIVSEATWTHLAVARTGTSCKVYVNGEDETSTADSHRDPAANNNDLRIAAATDNQEYWVGKIDEVRVYDYDRSEAQIRFDMEGFDAEELESSDSGLFYWDEDAYSSEDVYFEATIKCDGCSGGSSATQAWLINDVGSTVPSSVISTTSSSYTRVRTSSTVTLTDNEEYGVEVNLDATSGVAYLESARLIVVQADAPLTATETQVELGIDASTTSDALEALSTPKIYQYDHDAYNDGTINSYFESTIKSTTGPGPNLNVGETYPTTITTYNDGDDDEDWTNPSNVTVDDGSYADIQTQQFDSPDTTYVLRARNFPFSTSVPGTATIKGVQVTIERQYDDNGVQDTVIQLVNHSAGTQADRIGNNQSTGAAWPATDGTGIFGGSTDTWGASLTPAIVNSSNFGVDVQGQATGSNSEAFIDYIRMDVWYQEAGSETTGTAYAVLYNITNSQTVDTVSVNGTGWTRVRSASPLSTNWDESSDDEYEVRLYSSTTAHTTFMANAKIINQQTKASTITNTETLHQYNPVETSTTSDSYVSIGYDNNFNADNFANGTFEAYFEPTIKTSNGSNAYYARLDYGGGIGQVTGTDTSYTRKPSSDVWSNLPSSGTSDIDVQLRNNSAGTTTSTSTSWLKIKGSSISSAEASSVWRGDDYCIANKCMYFDGVDNLATVTSSYSIDHSDRLASEFSYVFWVRPLPDGESDTPEIFQKGSANYARLANEGSGDTSYIDLQVSLDLESGDAVGTFTDALALYDWNHVAIAYADDIDDEATVYVNGESIGTTSGGSGAPAADSNNLLIGGSTSNNFKGYIDEFSIHPYELSNDEILPMYNAGKAGISAKSGGSSTVLGTTRDSLFEGLVGYWKLDETSGNASDYSGNNRTLTNNGTTTYVGGKFGNGSEHVPASSQFLQASSTIDGVKTISFWANPDNTTNYFIQLTDSAYITSSSGTISATGFTDAAIYINGIESNSISADTWSLVTVTTNTAIDAETFRVGSANSNYYDGTFDEVRLYNRTLSASEIEDLYNWAPGPVAHWKLDENSGTYITDSSGNGNTSSDFTGDVAWATGKHGSGLYFDGTDDVVRIPETSSTDLGSLTDSYTVTAWFKTSTDFSDYAIIVGKVGPSQSPYPFRVYFDPLNRVTFRARGGGMTAEANSGVYANDGKWHHVAAVRDVSTDKLYIYVDAVLKDSADDVTTTDISNDDDVSIGNGWLSSYTTYDFEGVVDDVKIYNYVRTPQQIIQDMNAGHPTPGSPVGSALVHLKFNEGYGDTTYNLGLDNNDGDLGGSGSSCPGASACPSWTNSGKFGKALDFDGNDYVNFDDSFPYVRFGDGADDQPFTISGWVNMDEATDFPIVYYGTSATSIGYSLETVDTDKLRITLFDDNNSNSIYTETDSTFTTYEGQWAHVTSTYDGSESADGLKLYINGKLEFDSTGSAGSYTAMHAEGSYLWVGTKNEGSYVYADGKIDDVRVYSSEFTASQVALLYNQGVSAVLGAVGTEASGSPSRSADRAYCPPGDTTASCAPVAELKLDENKGTTAYDTAGGGYDGTLGAGDSAPSWSIGKFSSALNFDGTNDYVDIGTGPTSVKTVEFWTNPDTTTEYFVNLTSTTDYVWASSGTVTATGLATPTIYVDGIKTDAIVAGKWQHVVVTTDTAEDASNFDIGWTQDTNFMEGLIDNVKLYDYALSQEQVSWNYDRGKPIGHWKLDECEGAVAYDTSGRGNHGTITIGAEGDNTSTGTCDSGTGTEAWNNGTTGKRNYSLDFDGSDDYIDMNDQDEFDFPNEDTPFSISAWVYRDTFNTNDVIIAKKNNLSTLSEDGYVLYINPGDNVYFNVGDGSNSCTPQGPIQITSSGWYHIVGVLDSSDNCTVYINGVPGTPAAIASSAGPDNALDFRIGSESDSGNPFDGQIDDVKIFNYALTQQQIQTDLNQGGPIRFGPTSGAP